MNVLVVSSQPSFLKEGLKVLTQNGLVPRIRDTVEKALTISQTLTPWLVILDAEMASDDLAGTCRTLYDISRAPVIVVTWEELDPADAADCFDAGAGGKTLETRKPHLPADVGTGADPEALEAISKPRFEMVAPPTSGVRQRCFKSPSALLKQLLG